MKQPLPYLLLLLALLAPLATWAQCGTCTITTAAGTDNGAYTLNAGQTLCVPSGSTFTGSLNWNGGTICVSGAYQVSNNNMPTSGVVVVNSGGTWNTGINFSGGTPSAPSSFTVNAGGTATFNNSTNYNNNGNPLSITNAGTMTFTNTANLQTAVLVTNSGTLNANSGFTLSGDLENSGTLTTVNFYLNTGNNNNKVTNGVVRNCGLIDASTSSDGMVQLNSNTLMVNKGTLRAYKFLNDAEVQGATNGGAGRFIVGSSANQNGNGAFGTQGRLDLNRNGATTRATAWNTAPGGTVYDGNPTTPVNVTYAAVTVAGGCSSTVNLTGSVFEDPNYGGGAGRPLSTAGTAGRTGATVELYDASGAFLQTTTTTTGGAYTFAVPPGATYTVRVVNSTVTSSRTGYAAGLLPVQTYNGTTTRVGGENPAYQDAAANTGSQTLAALSSGTVTAESLAAVAVGSANTTGPDFGFNFDLVVNVNDAGQGSLRQFVLNSNALGDDASLAQSGSTRLTTSTTNTALTAGRETSIFLIPNGATGATGSPVPAGLRAYDGTAAGGPASQLTTQNSQQVAVINLASSLTVTGANATLTSIDGGTQTANVGNTNAAVLGTGGSVGTTGSLSYTSFSGPEVELLGVYTGTSPNGSKPGTAVSVQADNFWLRNVAVRNFGGAGGTDASVLVTNVPGRTGTLSGYSGGTGPQGAVGVVLENNVFGSDASAFAAPTPFATNEGANGRNSQHVAYNASGTSLTTKTLTVRTNLLGFSERRGVHFVGNTALTAGYNLNTSIYDNVFQDNGVSLSQSGGTGPYPAASAGDIELILTTTPFVEIYQNRLSVAASTAAAMPAGQGSDGIELNNAALSGSAAGSAGDRRDAGTAQAGSRIEQNSISYKRVGVLCQSNAAYSSYALDGVSFTGNFFSNNTGIGVYNQGNNHVVQNNLFSTNATGFTNVGPGVTFTGNTFQSNVTNGLVVGDAGLNATPGSTGLRLAVTGVVVGPGNVFTGNGSSGTGEGLVLFNTTTRASFTQNAYYANNGLAIDLNAASTNDGVTPNNGALNANFPNQELDYPVLATATLSGTSLALTGYVGSASGQTAFGGARVEFFKADNSPANQNGPLVAGDGLNVAHGEGRTYLGFLTAASDGTFSGTLTGISGLATGDFVTATASIGSAATASTSEFGNNVRVNEFPLSGYVFEDVNYGGGAGRPRTATGASVRPSATVEIYDNTGAFVATTTTNASGQYSVNVLPGTYTVRVVNSTVTSSRTGYAAGLLPVQTYNGTTTRVGGENPAYTDAAANTGSQTLTNLNVAAATGVPAKTAESIANVTVGNAATVGPDFGFNFDLVVNTNDVAVNGTATQGSLRQFILNSNALGGEASLAQSGSETVGTTTTVLPATVETSIFMIPSGAARAGLLASGNGGPASQLSTQNSQQLAIITPASALPAITGAYTSISGGSQTFNIGNTNNATLGSGGTVGTGATALAQLNGPEVQLTGSTAVATGLDVAASGTNTTIKGLAVLSFGNATDNDGNANIRNAANNLLLTQNVLGTTATSFSTPGTLTNADNVRLTTGTAGIVVSNNLIGYANSKGISIDAGVTNVQVTGNEVNGNGLAAPNFDGLDIQGNNATVAGNLFTGTSGQGIDSYRSSGGNSLTGNTVTNNGRGTTTLNPNETPGIRVYGAGNTVSQNIISGNYGAGIMLEGTNGGRAAVTTTLLSQNSIFNNGNVTSLNGLAASGEIGIDLQVTGDNEASGNSPYVTLNNASGTTGANGLVNYPILRTATVVGTNLVLTGYAKPGATIELFIAQPNPAGVNATGTNFGQGKTYLTMVVEGTNDADGSTNQSYGPGNINGFAQGSDNAANGFSFTIALPAGVTTGTVLTATSTLSGATSEFSGNVTAVAPLTGYVFTDPNYGGGAGRPRTASGATTRPGATVELYDNTGAFVATTTTDSNGQYSFNAPVGTGYTVRVVNSTVTSPRPGYVAGLLPVQTYAGLGSDANSVNRVGGQNPAYTDAAANTGTQTLSALSSGTVTPESIASVSVGTGTTNAGPDFGFNFDVVVNVNDAGQGSLRQFIANSNALGGETTLAPVYTAANGTTTALATGLETSIFMIPNGQAVAGQQAGLTNAAGNPNFTAPNNGSGTAATIQLASDLPNVTGPLTAIDGRTQTRSTGNSNAAVTTLGAESTGPEVLINLNGNQALDLAGSDDQLLAMGVYNSQNSGQGVFIASGAQRVILQENTINNNGANVTFQGTNSSTPSGATIQNNIIRDSQRGTADGIELNGNNSNMTITSNQFLRNAAFGIDFISGGNSGNTITNNTFAYNGALPNNSQRSGIGIRGGGSNNNLIQGNTFLNNSGPGVVIKSGATGNRILQNSFAGNGYNPYTQSGNPYTAPTGLGLGIDLDAVEPSGSNYDVGDGVTLNDSGDPDTGANGLLNFPIIQSAIINPGGTVTVSGFARPGVTVELYLAAADPTNFGEGQAFLTSFTQGTAPGTAGSVTTGAAASYGPGTLNDGVVQGSDNTLTYSYTFTPSPAQLTALRASTALLTSTATLATADANGNFGTSEFSGNARVFQYPVPNDATNVAIASNTTTPVTLSPSLSATTYGLMANVTTNTANSVAYYTVSLPTSGTLYYNNVPLTAANVGSTQVSNLSLLKFAPTFGSTATVTFTYTATDADGLTSTQHNTSGTVSNGPATYTIPLTAAADVTASLTGPTTLTSGQPTGTYTATFTNLGPASASSVTQVVTLPTGASLSGTQTSALPAGTVVNTTGSGTSAVTTLTFPPQGTVLAGASNSYRFSFTAPTTPGGSTLAANTTTGSSQGSNAAPDMASLALATNALTDVQAVLTASAATVAPGAAASFTATFQNNTAQPAAGVVATVQLPVGLTPTSVSGQAGTPSAGTVTYGTVASLNTTTGLLTYTLNALAANAQPQSVIAFVMPATSSVAATAALTTTTAESNTTNNVASASIAPAASFDLVTTLTGPASVMAGAPYTLNVTTSNKGPQAISGAVQTATIPAGLNATGSPNVFVSNGGTYNNSTGVVTFPALGSLPVGQTVANTITFSAPANSFPVRADVTPTAAGGDADPTSNTAYLNGATSSTNVTVNAASGTATNVYATLTANAQIVAAGTQVTYTAGYGNAGPATAASVTPALQLLPNLGLATLLVNNQAGTSTGGGTTITFPNSSVYTIATGMLAFANVALLPVSNTVSSSTVTVTVPAGVGNDGQLLATMSVGSQSPDLVPADNVQSVVVTVQPQADLATTLTGPTGNVAAGQTVSYTATFTNNGPGTARTVAETVQLPAGLTAANLQLNNATGTAGTGVVTFTGGASYNTATGLLTLPALTTDAVGTAQSFVVTFPAPAQSLVVSSAVGSETTDGTLTNNAASVATAVTATADVAVSVAGPATAVAGNQITYAVTATNNGPATATGVVPTLQLPANLSGVTVSSGSYDSGSGLVTFASTSSLAPGTSVVNYATLPMPTAPTGGSISPLASGSTTSYDNVAANNTAGITTSVAPGPGQSADLIAGITGPAGGTATAGASTGFTFTFQNSSGSASAAAYVRPVANLPAGLTATSLTVAGQPGTLSNGLVTYPNNSTYDPATGTLTFPTTASLAVGSTLSYDVAFPAPGSAQLLVTSEVTENTTDPVAANNAASLPVTVSPSFDLTTSITGPAAALAGQQTVYTVTTTASGASPAGPVTQTATLPLNQTVATLLVNGRAGTLSGGVITYPDGSTYNQGNGLLTFPSIGTLTPGAANAVTNGFTLTMPNVASLTIQANVGTLSGETNPGNNSNSATTTKAPLSFAPVAENIVNTLQNARGSTSNAPLLISPLYATDPDGSIAATNGYTILTLPTSGTLYYNGTAATANQTITNPALLSYQPAGGFVGNAFFTYAATDNSGLVSNTALYTIPVAQDVNSTYSTYNTTKGGSSPYVTGDILAQVLDPNTAQYTDVSGTGRVFNATTGALLTNAANGLPTTGTNATVVAGSLPAGVSIDPATGRIYVSNAAALPRVTTATSYPITVQTVDLNGGINQVPVTLVLGAYPLPVELVAFTAQAVSNRDGLLKWTTASEKDNDHFDVERSLDGTTYAKIGQVQGQGSKASATDYTLTDASVAARVAAGQPVYYRLKQVDLSGTSTYSPVRTVSFTGAASVTVSLYPNPAVAATSLDLHLLPMGNSYQVRMLDATGREVRQVTLSGGQVQELNLSDVASGTYQVLVTGQQPDGSALRQVLRLLKE